MSQKCYHKIFFWNRTLFQISYTKLRNFVVVSSSKREIKQKICKFFASSFKMADIIFKCLYFLKVLYNRGF